MRDGKHGMMRWLDETSAEGDECRDAETGEDEEVGKVVGVVWEVSEGKSI